MRKHKKENIEMDIWEDLNPFKFIQTIYQNIPKWTIIAGACTSVYIFMVFLLFFYVSRKYGTPGIINGVYALQYHGHIKEIINEQQYHYYRGLELWGTTGHSIIFYGVSLGPLYELTRKI